MSVSSFLVVWFFVSVIVLVIEELRIHSLRRECSRDRLTGLPSSRGFEQRILASLKKNLRGNERRGRRRTPLKSPGAIAFLDIDGFKAANDLVGHEAGDKILQILANTLCNSLRREDLIFRKYDAGDEFILFLSNTTVPDAKSILVGGQEQFEEAVERVFPKLKKGVSFSFGIATVLFSGGVNGIKASVRSAEDFAQQDKIRRKMGR